MRKKEPQKGDVTTFALNVGAQNASSSEKQAEKVFMLFFRSLMFKKTDAPFSKSATI